MRRTKRTATTHTLGCALCGCVVATRTSSSESSTEARAALAVWWAAHVRAARHTGAYGAVRYAVWGVMECVRGSGDKESGKAA